MSYGKPRAQNGEGHGSRTPERPHEGSRFEDDLRSNAPSEQPRHGLARLAFVENSMLMAKGSFLLWLALFSCQSRPGIIQHGHSTREFAIVKLHARSVRCCT